MRLFSGIHILLLGSPTLLHAFENNDETSITANDHPCYEWINGGDAEAAELTDWQNSFGGKIEFDDDAPLGSTRSFKTSERLHVSNGPSQLLTVDCFEEGKQYKITARLKLTDENDEGISCNKNAEWLDPDFCPIFTIHAFTFFGAARENIGSELTDLEWVADEWNPYGAIFTIDERLASAAIAVIHIRGPRPGVNIYFDDVSVTEFVGTDSPFNFWTGEPGVNGTNNLECISSTSAESINATSDILFTSNYTYEKYGDDGAFDSSDQCALKNGDAESGQVDQWIPMGSEGGSITMHNVGPDGSSKSFMHLERPHYNSGPGQENIDLSCFELNERYELKAKIKLVDGNGFPYQCDKSPESKCDDPCPMFTFVHLSGGGVEQNLPLHNSLDSPWIAEEFNEYYAIFEVTQTFLDSTSVGLFINGVKAGINIIFDDVSLTKYTGSEETTTIPETDKLDGTCTSLVISGEAETGDINDWEIKDVLSGELVIYPEGPGNQTKSFQHKGRSHVSSGPGQGLNVSCLEEGKQYILTADTQLIDENYGDYACDKYAGWLDPDFCPLFSIRVEEGSHNAKLNLGNDYPEHKVGEENAWNPYQAIFTVDKRLAATKKAYLYVRGPRPNATIIFNNVAIQEYVGADTRYNFWTGLGANDTEVSYDEVPESTTKIKETSNEIKYIYYGDSTYEEAEGSDDPCGQLVRNGDAENGNMKGWKSFGVGKIVDHSEGPPPDGTKSFKLVDRNHFNSGPGQWLDLSCLKKGQLYEVKAKIKLFDENGFPYQCAGNYWRHNRACPMFSINMKLATGKQKYINQWNDIQQNWYADWFNEFHAIFQASGELVDSVQAYWVFRGVPGHVSLAFDDVSIKPYIDQKEELVKVEKPPGCQALTYNGDAEVGSLSGWKAYDGNAHLSLDEDGPDGEAPAFKLNGRIHVTNGPGQVLDISCLEKGREYKVTGKFFLEDARGDAMECNPGSNWNTPLYCPVFSIHYFQPWSDWSRGIRENFENELDVPHVAGWNDFEVTFEIPNGAVRPEKAVGYFRGPATDVVMYFDDIEVPMVTDADVYKAPVVPSKDPDFRCIGYCCKLASNGDAESGLITDWITRPEGDGIIVLHDTGADGSKYSIKHTKRKGINRGPGQFIDTNCFVAGQLYEIDAKVMILDEKDQPISCNKTVDWGDSDFCPLFSIWITDKDGDDYWMDVPNIISSDWNSSDFNEYHGFFKMNGALLEATEASFVFRGPKAGTQIVVDSVSLSPYQHVPDYQPEGYDVELDFFASASTLEVNPYTEPTCDVPIINGDFEMGDTTGWTVNNGGVLSMLRCEENGGTYCLKVDERTSNTMGPKQALDLRCLEKGRKFDVSVMIKMVDESWEPVGCDKFAGPTSTCPILTLQYTTASGEEKHKYIANRALPQWDEAEFNEFYGIFRVTEEMATATDGYFYFERAEAGTILIMDNVVIDEFIDEADALYKRMTKKCTKFVLNGNAESGELRGWSPRYGGDIVLYDHGADMTEHSIRHTGRRSFLMGPKHDLAIECFSPGMRYNFEAKLKIIDDETGEDVNCDKSKEWIDDDACPQLTFQLEKDGKKSYQYYNSKTKGKWQNGQWNFFLVPFDILKDMYQAEKGFFYFERARAGVSIVVDEVSITRDCLVLISNWDAEIASLFRWEQHGGSKTSLTKGGANGSSKAFVNFNRAYFYSGPKHMLDVGCLVLGSRYTLSLQFKLLDAENDNAPVACNKNVGYGHDASCPQLTLALYLPGEIKPKYLRYQNTDDSELVVDDFNPFVTNIVITEEIQSANSAQLIINGPRGGLSMVFDQVLMTLQVHDSCEDLIPNGHFENHEPMDNWSVAEFGELAVRNEGADGSASSLMCTNRLKPNDGPMSKISSMCMYEGLMFELTAHLKLLDEDGIPFSCDKGAAYGTPLACPVLAIEMQTITEYVMIHPENIIEADWVADGWNKYKAVFVVNNDLANAELAYFKFKGPAPGISILVDDMTTTLYEPDTVNCAQLISDTTAESGTTGEWETSGGGYIEVINGGDDSTKAFAHYGRGGASSGPKQHLYAPCLRANQIYDLNARFMFIDEDNNSVGCDKEASWGHADFCVQISLVFRFSNGDEISMSIDNDNEEDWIVDEFNTFTGAIEISEAMKAADSLHIYIKGPSEDKIIVYDNISMRLRE